MATAADRESPDAESAIFLTQLGVRTASVTQKTSISSDSMHFPLFKRLALLHRTGAPTRGIVSTINGSTMATKAPSVVTLKHIAA
ncbi:MAG TPA: hypothetical protein VMV26_18825, partial [Alphaproteobacteria bacterium]|nr:hypothetical protein [Alphaproteobacteria bacterium]